MKLVQVACVPLEVFLATVIGLYNREIIGWSMPEHHRAKLVRGAIEWRKRTAGSDVRRCFTPIIEYTSRAFGRCLQATGRMRFESFFASLKKELVIRADFEARTRAIDAVANYIEMFSNHKRPHTLGHRLPDPGSLPGRLNRQKT